MTAFLVASSKVMAVYGQSGRHDFAAAAIRKDVRRYSLLFDMALVIRTIASAAAAPAWATVSGMSRGPWQQPAMKMPSVNVLTGASFGLALQEKTLRATAHVEETADVWASACGSRPVASHHHIDGNAAHKSSQRIFDPNDELAFLLRGHAPIGDFADAAPHKVDAFLVQLVVELLVAFARGADVDVEIVDLGSCVLLEQVGPASMEYMQQTREHQRLVFLSREPTQWMMPMALG